MDYEKAIEGLNEGQVLAFKELLDYVEFGGTRYISLKGYAGTGKTFMLSRFIPYLLGQKFFKSKKIAITAPTHKALAVAQEHFGKLKLGSRFVSFATIQKILGVKPHIDDITGKEVFVSDGEVEINYYKLLIVDETSMLDDTLFDLINDAVETRSLQANNPLRVIFVGDPKQVPPVNKVDCEPYLNPCIHDIKEIYLDKIMRQADGNMIIEASMHVREVIDGDKLLNLEQFVRPNQFEIYNTGLNHVRQGVAALFKSDFTSEEFKTNPSSIRVIAWRNVTVNSYNLAIRKMYHGEANLPQFIKGDILIANRPYFEGEIALFNNSDEMVVTGVGYDNIYVENYNQFGVELDSVVIKAYMLKCEMLNEPDNKKVEVQFPVPTELSKQAFDLIQKNIASAAKSAKFEKRKHLWASFWKNQKRFGEVNYGFAITTHKAQGSTYKKTYVDLNDMNRNEKAVERNRIIYTAITRAKEQVIVISK